MGTPQPPPDQLSCHLIQLVNGTVELNVLSRPAFDVNHCDSSVTPQLPAATMSGLMSHIYRQSKGRGGALRRRRFEIKTTAERVHSFTDREEAELRRESATGIDRR
jgi:hypothetical protein